MRDRTLPRDVAANDEADLVCPWCRADCCDASVTLESLFVAAQAGELEYAHRDDHQTADPRALVAACPSCARPFMITAGRWKMRLLAVRTSADAELLFGSWATLNQQDAEHERS